MKNIDIRRFLGYVCQIAKVRVRINFGWVSLFTQKYVKCDFFGHMRIDIKSDYQFYTFFCFVSMCGAHRHSDFQVYMCAYRHKTYTHRPKLHTWNVEAHLVLFGGKKKVSEQEFRRPHHNHLTSFNSEIDRRDDGNVLIAGRIPDI